MIIRKECPLCGQTFAIRMSYDDYARFLYGSGLIQDRLPNTGAVEREFLKTGYCHSCQELIFGGFNKPNMEMWVEAELLEMAEKILGYCGMGCVCEFDDDTHLDFITMALANADKKFLDSLKNVKTEQDYLALEIHNNDTLVYYMQDGKDNIKGMIEE